jgi:catechol 2,3-dioxygenase-like lactoylglutathione lyase family enzyme
MELLDHITFLTEDLDRLSAFYERVFDAAKTLDMTEEGVRHVFLEIGPRTVLHPFQILDGPALPPAPGTMSSVDAWTTSPCWRRSRRRFARSAAASRQKARPTETSAT